MVKISVMTPTYNEAENVSKLVDLLHKALKGKCFEIIIIDDNSPDGTAEVARKLSGRYENIKLLCRPVKMGIGSAYKDGFRLCSGDVIAYMDADLSHDPRSLPKLIEALENADIAVGSRFMRYGGVIGWGWYRYLINLGANLLARLILKLDVKDTTSGYKAYKRKAFEKLVSISNFGGFTDFDEEMLYLAKKHGLKVKEIPITFANRERGNSKLRLRDILAFIKALLDIRLRFGACE
ncbi:MAG: polyprenol monophosphomannose synthase [Candidatus Bathyarchaeia archaeon]